MQKSKTIQEYITQFDEPIKSKLLELYHIIKQTIPDAAETISYGIPAFKLQSNLVYFAGYKNHIGLYPHASPIIAFANELAQYKTSKGAIQFPIDKPLPEQLIIAIIRFRLNEMKTLKLKS